MARKLTPPLWQIQADGGPSPCHYGQYWIVDRPRGPHRTHPSTCQLYLYPHTFTVARLGRQVSQRTSIHSRRVPALLFIL